MNKLKKFMTFITAAAVALSVTACVGINENKIEETAYPVTVLNMQFDNPPNSVACLSPTIATMLIDLGYSDKIVGFSDDFTGESATQDNQIGTGLELNMEQIGKLAPEIVFTNVPIAKAQMDKLESVNVRVMVMPAVTNIEEVKQRYLDLVAIMEGALALKAKGAAFVAEIDRVIAHIEATVPMKQSFLYIASLEPVIATEDTIQSAIATAIIGENAVRGQTDYSVPIELIETFTPDIILYDSNISPEDIKASEIFGELSAVKDGNMISVKGSDMLLTTNGISAVAEILARTVYEDVDFTVPAPAPVSDVSNEQ